MAVIERTTVWDEWDLARNVACVAGVYNHVGTFTNDDPNSIIYLGGKHGYIYITASCPGGGVLQWRILSVDANEIVRKMVWSSTGHMAAAGGGGGAAAYDKTRKLKLDLRKPGIKYKSYFKLELRPTVACTHAYDHASTTAYIDITRVTN